MDEKRNQEQRDMAENQEAPCLRGDIEAVPILLQGIKHILLRDPMQLSKDSFVASPGEAMLLTFLNGKNSLLDIQAAVMRQTGELIYRDRLETLVEKLEAHFLLRGKKLEDKQRQVEEKFRSSPVREAWHAGSSYESEPEKLRAQLASFFSDPRGPGPLNKKEKGVPQAIIAPHIDMTRGGVCSAWAYAQLGKDPSPERYIILGTAHVPMQNLFVPLEKDFQTPLGIMPCDREFLQALRSRYRRDMLQDEAVHRTEHSIEFQAVFLRYLCEKKRACRIVPILCSSFHKFWEEGKSPEESSEVSDFLEALGEVIREKGGTTCFVAGADLSHLGMRFGDPPLTNSDFARIETEDKKLLEPVAEIDARGFFSAIASHGDRYRICGLSSIYVLLKSTEAKAGKLLRYEQWPDPDGRTMVSGASLAFY